ncbi:PHP domain-containing protein [Intestinibacillus sp. Marseille-P6563]|uniref:PHP domain-containing protein n=1 Tax=Intestinibacillus sp. Marseille-P6563 TaxID=2364792 RepID=UPI000F06D14E|nr:PHP domain-containing protein [Intestinibacillus sp. Marseille-P6563]
MAQTDLHMHSSASLDEEISPRGLAERCRQNGMTLAALTDHNSVEGVAEFMWRGAQLGVRTIPGIELDCMEHGHNLHILGYGLDIADQTLKQALHEIRALQTQAGVRLMDAVEALGIRFEREQVLEQAKGGIVSAEGIAASALQLAENQQHPLLRPLLPGGELSDRPLVNFYWSVCAPGKPAYQPVDFPSAGQVIDWIHAAGGIAVLAHPGASLKNGTDVDAVLTLPLDGVEVFTRYHNAAQTAFYLEKTQQKGLLVTGGSDFHGRIKPDLEVGDIDFSGMESKAREMLLAALD